MWKKKVTALSFAKESAMRRKLASLAVIAMSLLVLAPAGADELPPDTLPGVERDDDGWHLCMRSNLIWGPDYQYCIRIGEDI